MNFLRFKLIVKCQIDSQKLLSYPKVKKRADGNFFIKTFRIRKMRLVNGQKIKSLIQPNLYPPY